MNVKTDAVYQQAHNIHLHAQYKCTAEMTQPTFLLPMGGYRQSSSIAVAAAGMTGLHAATTADPQGVRRAGMGKYVMHFGSERAKSGEFCALRVE